jgi:hypothetical protein
MKKVLFSVCAVCLLPGLLFAKDVHLDYSTYLGGTGGERYASIAVDSQSQIYLAGKTQSNDFPTVNPYQPDYRTNGDACVSKLSEDGQTLLYSTYLGGTGWENAFDLALDSSDHAYLVGTTDSGDFPTKNAYQASHPGWETGYYAGFVSKLSSSGSALIYSTYLGGGDDEETEGYGIALDPQNCAYVTGYTDSSDFPTVNPYQASKTYPDSRPDVFVSKFSSSGSYLIYSTYFGGNRGDEGQAIALDSANRAYLTGWTESTDGDLFPLVNAYQPSYGGGGDAFVSCLSSSGSDLLYSTYLGGGGGDKGYDISVDLADRACLTGWTRSSDADPFPTLNAYQSSFGGSGDAFVSKLSSSGSFLLFSTYLGGSSYDEGYGLSLDNRGGIYLAGETSSSDFPTNNPYQASRGGADDIFVTHLAPSGSTLVYSTYLGGSSNDERPDICLNWMNRVYVAGNTVSNDFPTQNPYQAGRAGNRDFFISILRQPPPASVMHTDYNGDATSDIAIFRESSGLWAIRGISRIYFGTIGDEPVPGDYDGDGTTEGGIFRPTAGLWALRGVSRIYFGGSSDEPVPGDYDGDRIWEAGIFRSSSGLWAIRGVTRVYYGGSGDTPIPSDYVVEGVKMIGIFRDSTGLWAARNLSRIYYGTSGDIPLPANYDSSPQHLTSEPVIFRPSSGLWAIISNTRVYYGGASDSPVPADYTGNSADSIAIFRPATGLWAVRNITRVYFGGSGDQAVTE